MVDEPNMAVGASIKLVADKMAYGQRVDRFLAQHLEGVSRVRVQALMREGHVSRAGVTISDPAQKVKPGEPFFVFMPEPVSAKPKGEAIALDILYEDDALIVIDKPAGLVVHPSAGHETGTLVHALICHCGSSLSGIGGVRRPGIVHRLDKDTSGVLVVAKSDRAHVRLSEQFAAHGRDGRLLRSYTGVCWRVPSPKKGVIDAPLGRSKYNRKKMAVVTEALGRKAVTHYGVERTYHDPQGADCAALLRLVLETGRTHQIRVHLAHIHHPLLGDPVYGAGFKASALGLSSTARTALEALSRQALHAAELSFEHPLSLERMSFCSPLPEDLTALIAAMEG